ncbi:MAG: hypothetical protein ACYS4W_11465 [Planctomycetota bacterium]
MRAFAFAFRPFCNGPKAYYDVYIKARHQYETELERQANEALKKADTIGSLRTLDEGRAILDKAVTQKVRPESRARAFELAKALRFVKSLKLAYWSRTYYAGI